MTALTHGTDSGYQTHGCRCEPCTRAHAAYMRGYRRRRGKSTIDPGDPRLRDIIGVLEEPFTDNGIGIWLDAANRRLDDERPIELCHSMPGRVLVYAEACRLADGAW